jgi:hypothetical protein
MKAEFKEKQLIQIPDGSFGYNFLSRDFGKEMFDEYNDVVNSKYKNNRNLKSLKFDNNIINNSNVFSTILMNKLLYKYGLRAINPADAQKIIDHDREFLKEVGVYLGIVLRTEEKFSLSNYSVMQITNKLAEQAKERNYKF